LLILVGLAVVFGSLVYGYTMHGGKIAVLMQTAEFIIIGGACAGALVIGNKPTVIKKVFSETLGLLKPSPYGKEAFQELLQVLYDIFYAARKEGLVGIESHVEKPEESELFKKYKTFYGNPEAVAFLSDTLKVLLTGAVEDHHLSEILDLDLEQRQEEAREVPEAVMVIADALPGFGIVAAVLGVIITMGKIGGSPEVVGKSVAAALVGTFLGVLLAYAVVGPLGKALSTRVKAQEAYLACIRTALLSFARGDPPITSVEFARRNIEPHDRPSFQELEDLTRRRGRPAA
jgi:chemotaxis protein MotA